MTCGTRSLTRYHKTSHYLYPSSREEYNDCNIHRGISSTLIITKVLASTEPSGLTPIRGSTDCEQRVGFRPRPDCIDQIFALRHLLETRTTYPPTSNNRGSFRLDRLFQPTRPKSVILYYLLEWYSRGIR